MYSEENERKTTKMDLDSTSPLTTIIKLRNTDVSPVGKGEMSSHLPVCVPVCVCCWGDDHSSTQLKNRV